MNPNKPLKILFLPSWYPSRVHATLGNFCQRHAQAIATKNTVTVLYITKEPDLANAFEITDNKVENVREIICYYKNKGILGTGYIKAFNHAVSQVLSKEIKSYDLVHVNVLFKAGWLALQLNKKHKTPYIITEHWTGYHVNNGKYIGFLERFLSKKIAKSASEIVPVSEHLKIAMQKFGLHASYKVVPNVVNTDLFTLGNEKNDKFTFVHVSSLKDDHKNVSGIIRSFSKIRNDVNAQLKIIGDGDITPYKKLAKDLELTKNEFLILGEQSLSEVACHMNSSDCLVLFSNYENQPCVIPEAHACGIPVISSDVGGIKEHLTEEHGLIIEKGNENALCNAMKTMFQNHSDYDSDWLRNYTISHFSVDAIATAYSEIYSKTVSGGRV